MKPKTMRRYLSTPKRFRIGVIADTHGLFDQAILRHFKNVEHIIHAGDIGGQSVIEQLEAIAPVTAVSGNVDGYGQSGFPPETLVKLAGRRIAIRHILYQGGKLTKDGRAFLERERPDVCVFGHTHQPKIEWFEKTLLVNPGSAGPKRFSLPRGIGVVTITSGQVSPTLIQLSNPVRRRTPQRASKERDLLEKDRSRVAVIKR